MNSPYDRGAILSRGVEGRFIRTLLKSIGRWRVWKIVRPFNQSSSERFAPHPPTEYGGCTVGWMRLGFEPADDNERRLGNVTKETVMALYLIERNFADQLNVNQDAAT